MAAVTRKKDIRVVIEPQGCPRYMTEGKTEEQLENHLLYNAQNLLNQVLRHLDDYVGAIVTYDRVVECGFCENEWTDSQTTKANATMGEPEGMPICCDAAQGEFWRENPELWAKCKAFSPWNEFGPNDAWPWEVAK